MPCQIYALGRAGKSLALSLADINDQPDVLFLSVPDDAIFSIAQKLFEQPSLPPIVAHLSGAYSYELLEPLRHKTAIAQFHPLTALTGEKAIPTGSLCAISSDQDWARQALCELAQKIGLIPVQLDPHKATEYHAAAVLTGNLTFGLVQQSIKLMQQAGIDPVSARLGLAKLLKSAAENLEQHEIHKALTGPVARGDTRTIQKHLKVLTPEVRQVYETLSEWLVFQR